MKKTLWRGFIILAMMAQVVFAGQSMAADESTEEHRAVFGTVEKVMGPLVSIKTEEGKRRAFTLRDSEREDFKRYQPGDTVILEMEDDKIVDMHRPGVEFSSRRGHRELLGTVETFSESDKTVTIRTMDGESRTFGVRDMAISKVDSLPEGAKITLEVDEQNRIMDVHPAAG